MKRNLKTLVLFTLIAISAAMATALEQRVITADNFPVDDPILLSAGDGSHLYSVTGHYDDPGWGFAVNVSTDGGWTWSETYNNYQGENHFHFDAVFSDNAVYVARIDSWTDLGVEKYELIIQRFDINGTRDTSFGGSGWISISGQTTSVLSDVSLVAERGFLDVFWIKDSTLHHSYLSISGGSTTPVDSGLPATTATGSLDAVAMSGQSTDFFAAFRNGSGELVGWRWKANVGTATIDITPDEDIYPEWESVTVASYGSRVSVVVGLPYDSSPTKIQELWSDDDAITWNQEVLATGWDDVNIHVVEPSVAVGPNQTVVTYMVKDDTASTEEWGYMARANDGEWTTPLSMLTSSTDFVGSTMGMCWSSEGGFTASYFSADPLSCLVYFVKLPQLMLSGFEQGDFKGWSQVIGN